MKDKAGIKDPCTKTAPSEFVDDQYDPEWLGWNKDEEPYKHDWNCLPDFVGMNNIEFYFNITHDVLDGIHKGIYSDNRNGVNKDCFGTKYVGFINNMVATT